MKLKYFMGGISIALVLIFQGCGGGGSSSSSASSESVSGTVESSFYEGAIVCFDTNGNGKCDKGEPQTTSDKNGNFTLKGEVGDIIAEIRPGAKKHEVLGDTGVVIDTNSQTVFAIPKDAITDAKNSAGKVVLSAISTKLYTYVKETHEKDIKKAIKVVADTLGISEDDLLKDFNSETIDPQVKQALREKNEAILTKIKGKADLEKVKDATKNFVAAINLPSRIEVINKEE